LRKLKAFALVIGLLGAAVVAQSAQAQSSSFLERRVIGTSLMGRPIEAVRLGTKGGVVVVVVGVIHGNEEAGLLITDTLQEAVVPNGIDLWIIPTMNPDGTALDQRGNANQVDLNRNFPYNWKKMGKPGYWQYAGKSKASEPETKAVVAFMRQIKPALGIWYHQDLNIISPGKGLEGKMRTTYSRLTGIPIKRITGGTYTGVAATWQRRSVKDGMAFVVELGETLNLTQAQVHSKAVLDIAMLLRDAPSSKLGK
jgi:protein MpaA